MRLSCSQLEGNDFEQNMWTARAEVHAGCPHTAYVRVSDEEIADGTYAPLIEDMCHGMALANGETI